MLSAAAVIGAASAGAMWVTMQPEGPPARPAASVAGTAERAKGAPEQGTPDRAKIEAELTALKAEIAKEKAAAEDLRKREQELAKKSIAAQEKLAAVVKGTGEVTREGDEIHLQLVDKVLFPRGEAELTERGEAVLAKIGAALNQIPDKQIWVQGHTDDTPVRAAKGKKDKKSKKDEAPAFESNWELSAARALSVVHYLQDDAKVDPRRLAAVAFSQYRPASKTKAKNRRIEIVLYPKHQLAKE